jgi:hypothetical protein
MKTNKNTNTKRGMLDHKFDTIGKSNYPKTVESPSESLDITLSLSPTSNSREEEVSWSSSEGSTYYSEDEADEISLRRRRRSISRPSPMNISRPKENGRSNNSKTGGSRTDNRRDPSRRSTSQSLSSQWTTEDDVRTQKIAKRNSTNNNKIGNQRRLTSTSVTATKNKIKSPLKNVDIFSEIEIATSSEDLSTTHFLTTEDTAEVFCTRIVPFEVTTENKLSFVISTISVSSSDDESCITADCSKSDIAIRHHRFHRFDRKSPLNSWESGTESPTIKSQETEKGKYSSARTTSTHISNHTQCSRTDKNLMDVISIACQETVSSFESMSSWDDLSLDSDICADGDDDIADEPNLQQNRDTLHQHEEISKRQPSKDSSKVQHLKSVTSLRIDSRVDKIKKKLEQQQQSDLTRDERIKELKAKIKNMQQESFLDNEKLPSRSTNTSKGNSSTEIISSLSLSLPPGQIHDEVERNDAANYCNTDTTSPLINKCDSKQLKHRNKTMSTKGKVHRSPEIPTSHVPLIIPVFDREEISVMECDVKSTVDVELDIETGQHLLGGSIENGVEDSICSSTYREEKSKFDDISDRTKILTNSSKIKAKAAYDSLLLYLVQGRKEFEKRPRNEQLVIIAMAALSFIFLVLVLVMIVQ